MHRNQFKARIEELRSIKGDGALDPHGLDWLEKTFMSHHYLPIPNLYPNGIGGVRLEWGTVRWGIWLGGVELLLDVDLKTRQSLFYEWNKNSGKSVSKKIDHSKDISWNWVSDRLFYWESKHVLGRN